MEDAIDFFFGHSNANLPGLWFFIICWGNKIPYIFCFFYHHFQQLHGANVYFPCLRLFFFFFFFQEDSIYIISSMFNSEGIYKEQRMHKDRSKEIRLIFKKNFYVSF